MLQRKIDEKDELVTHGFMLAVEVDASVNVDPSYLQSKIADSIRYVEGVGDTDCAYLGTIDVYAEETETENEMVKN